MGGVVLYGRCTCALPSEVNRKMTTRDRLFLSSGAYAKLTQWK